MFKLTLNIYFCAIVKGKPKQSIIQTNDGTKNPHDYIIFIPFNIKFDDRIILSQETFYYSCLNKNDNYTQRPSEAFYFSLNLMIVDCIMSTTSTPSTPLTSL